MANPSHALLVDFGGFVLGHSRDFAHRAIPSPSGRAGWASATRSFEENVLTHLGHLMHGRMNEQLPDQGLPVAYLRGSPRVRIPQDLDETRTAL